MMSLCLCQRDGNQGETGKTEKQLFLSPIDEQFLSRRVILQHLRRIGYSETEKKKDGWESNENLPVGWLYRETSTRNKGRICASVTILTVECYVFIYYKMASGKW